MSEQGAHNTLLGLAVELGVFGLVLYVAILVGVIRKAVRSVEELSPGGTWWVLAFSFVYLFTSMFIYSNQMGPNLIFFGTLGALAGLSLPHKPAPVPTVQPSRPISRQPLANWTLPA